MKLRRHIAVELATAVAAILLVVLGVYTWLAAGTVRQEVLAVAERDASRMAAFVEGNLRLAMLRDHREDVRRAVSEVMEDPLVVEVAILDHEGRVRVASDRGSEGIVQGKGSRACAFCHESVPPRSDRTVRTIFDEGLVVSTNAIVADPGCLSAACHSGHGAGDVLGILSLTQSAESTLQVVRRSRATLLSFSVLAVLLASILVGTVIAGLLHAPMRRLVEGTERIAAGDLEHRLPVDRSDEFGNLAHQFNEMSSKLAQSRRSLVQSERLASMGKLAAGVAHELNNPLTGILAFAECLVDGAEPGDARLEDFRVIHRESLRCREIVRDLLDFVRQEKPSARPESADRIVGLALKLVRRQAAFANVEIRHEPDPDLPAVLVDPTQLQQVLLNLLVNAADAVQGRGSIVVASRTIEEGRWVEVSVSDDGSGIPEDIRDRIFEPFFSTKGRRSNGLGLSICHGIVEHHGGRIVLESEPGRGATFRIQLPAADRAVL